MDANCFVFLHDAKRLLLSAIDASHIHDFVCISICSGPFNIKWNVTGFTSDIKPGEGHQNETSASSLRSAVGSARVNSCRYQILLHDLNFRPGAFLVEIVVSSEVSTASLQFNFSIVRPEDGT